jgi:hypothetical protein
MAGALVKPAQHRSGAGCALEATTSAAQHYKSEPAENCSSSGRATTGATIQSLPGTAFALVRVKRLPNTLITTATASHNRVA